MRIVQAIFNDTFAGAERYAIELANYLSANHEAFLLLNGGLKRSDPTAMLGRISRNVRCLFVDRVDGVFFRSRVAAALETVRPNIVHCHLWKATDSIVRLRHRPACVATLHLKYQGGPYKRCDGLLRVSEWETMGMRDYSGASVTIWPWTLPGSVIDRAERKAIRAGFGIGDDDAVLIGVGRLARQKGFDVLIEALKQLNLPGRAVQAWIVGEGEERKRLERIAGPNVRLLGFRSDTSKLLRAADLFVFPSRFETFRLALAEAMDAGLPIVASDLPVIGEVAGANALNFVEVENAPALAAMIGQCLRRCSVPEYDLSRFRIETQASKIVNFYETVLARKAGIGMPELERR